VGSELEPELGGALYSALTHALEELENTKRCGISGIFGFQIPEIEGIGLFTTENEYFRIYFLCEGLYDGGIPYLTGKELLQQIDQLFNKLDQIELVDLCSSGHKIRGGTFWFNLISSIGLKSYIHLEEIKKVYPLRLVRINLAHDDKNKPPTLQNLEVITLGSLGHGWEEIEQLISTKVEGIFNDPTYSFNIYKTLFHQFNEYTADFIPKTVILTYNDELKNNVSLLAFLSLDKDELNIRFCLPVGSELVLKGEHSIFSCLQTFLLNSY
jgi:hypothetical protein